MKKILSIIVLSLISFAATAQSIVDEYDYLKSTSLYDTADRWSLRVYEHNFFKNNEYFGDFVKGYTLTGFHFRPELTYALNGQLQFQLMWNVLKYHGYENFSENRPYFRIVFRPRDYFTIIGGYLEGNVRHDMVEPIYNPERAILGTYLDRYFTRNVENGIQLLIDRPRYSGDMWMNWENFILWGDNDKERLSVGHVSKFRVADRANFRSDIVAEFLVAHRGGQIDSCEGQVQSLENGALGMDFHWTGSDEAAFRQFSVRAMVVQYHAMDGTPDLPWDDGVGTYLKAHLRLWNFGLTAGHWYANKFLSFRGDPLFTCWALDDALNRECRSMAFGELYFGKRYFSDVFTLRTGISAYYDIKASQMEYSYMISMLVSPKWAIGRRLGR